MYKSETTHRFPALVLAAGFTAAVVIGLSALAQTQSGMTARGARELVNTTPSVTRVVASDVAPMRVDVIAYRS